MTPDFCIYNDVFVHHPDGRIEIFGYPEAVFPPTDFHTATLSGEHIWIIGSLGYKQLEPFGQTPVFRLHTQTLVIERVHPTGVSPGSIHQHRADLIAPGVIAVSGGTIMLGLEERTKTQNQKVFVLDLQRMCWTS